MQRCFAVTNLTGASPGNSPSLPRLPASRKNRGKAVHLWCQQKKSVRSRWRMRAVIPQRSIKDKEFVNTPPLMRQARQVTNSELSWQRLSSGVCYFRCWQISEAEHPAFHTFSAENCLQFHFFRQCDPFTNGNLTLSLCCKKKNETARLFFQVHIKQLGFSADEFHSVFDFKARTEKQLMLEKLWHLEILKANRKIILLQCILCLLHPSQWRSFFFFSK